MRIRKLTTNLLLNVKAKIITNKNNGAKHFNIRHGSASEGLHDYVIYTDNRYFKPEENENEGAFNDDDYILKPVYKNDIHIQDRKDNYSYTISKDDVEDHKKDYIVLWEIPNKFYTDVKYEVSGNAIVLGTGYSGRVREGTLFSSPAPVLEVYGTTTLEWSGIRDNVLYKQKVTFKDDQWSIGQVIKDTIESKDE